MTDRLYGLAADDPAALALLRLAHTDAEEQWTTPQLRVEIVARRVHTILDIDGGPDLPRYVNLRTAVEKWVQEDSGWPSDLTPDEADGEVLWALYVLLHRTFPCREAFRTAYRLDMLHDAGSCECGKAVA